VPKPTLTPKKATKEHPPLLMHYTFIVLIVISFIISIIAFGAAIMQINKPFLGFRMEPTLTVSAVNESEWAGIKAGLKEADKIIKMNDIEVSTPAQVREILQNTSIGDNIKYTISHKGDPATKTTDIFVQVKTFTISDFSKTFLTFFIVGIAFLIVGTIAYLFKPTNKITQAHLLLMIAVGLCSTLASDYDLTMIFPRVWIIAAGLTGATSLHLGLVFPDPKRIVQKHPFVIYIPYIIGLILASAWELVFKQQGFLKMGQTAFEMHVQLYELTLVWAILIGFGGMLAMMIHSLVITKAEKYRQQLKVGLYGSTVAFAPMIFLWLIPLMLEHPLDTSGTLATICWILFITFPISVTYAVLKHKLFDIDFVIKQSMIYTVLLVFLGGGYSLVATAVQYALVLATGKPSELTYLFLAIVIALIFDPVRSAIHNFIDKRFFREKYILRLALSEFIEKVGTTLDKDALFSGIKTILNKYFHPKHVSVFLKVPSKNSLLLAYSENFPDERCNELSLDNPFVRRTFNLANIIVDAKRGTAKLAEFQPLEDLEVKLSIPIVAKTKDSTTTTLDFKDEIIGLLNLGQKLSELDYTDEEEELLCKLMQQAALTIHHAQLTDEMVEKERMKAEYERARSIQLAMLPQKELEVHGYEITGFMESADETGGDYYDWYSISNNQFLIGVGDVTGHGIEAALVVAMAKSCLHNQISFEYEVPPVMKSLNTSIYDLSHRQAGTERKLMTFVYAVFDTDKHSIRLSAAGHWFPYIYQVKTETLSNFSHLKPTYPLGVRPPDKFRCQTGECILEKGDVLVFFTDGLHEATNEKGEEFGLERLESLIKEYYYLSVHELKERIIIEWKSFIGNQKPNDDITFVVVKKTL